MYLLLTRPDGVGTEMLVYAGGECAISCNRQTDAVVAALASWMRLPGETQKQL
jgi:hypothetical protein